jgi:hypothetical protein
VASISPDVLFAFKSAAQKHDFEEAIRIASQPQSGLKVKYVSRSARGQIVGYLIVNSEGCLVVSMRTTVEDWPHPRPGLSRDPVPLRIPDASATPATQPPSLPWIDEFEGTSLGDTHGITYAPASGGMGAVFSRTSDSRIEYRNLPREGTLEWWVRIDSGYHYANFALSENEKCAVLFTSDVNGGDVTWPGATRLILCDNGDITLDMAEKKYDAPHQVAKAMGTLFRFGEWHAVGISFGSEGQRIALDGVTVNSVRNHRQSLGAAGNHLAPVDVPTIGQSVSGFWNHHQHEGGFEGIVGRFRASGKQGDWFLCKAAPRKQDGRPAIGFAPANTSSPVSSSKSARNLIPRLSRDSWNSKKPTDWSQMALQDFLTKSPWVQYFHNIQAPSDVVGPRGRIALFPAGDVVIRWESAALVRDALARVESKEYNDALAGFSKDYYVIAVIHKIPGGNQTGNSGLSSHWSREQEEELRDVEFAQTGPSDPLSQASPDRMGNEGARRVFLRCWLLRSGYKALSPARVESGQNAEGRVELLMFPRAMALDNGSANVEIKAAFPLGMGLATVTGRFSLKNLAEGSERGL